MSLAGIVNIAILVAGTSLSAGAGSSLASADAAFGAQSGRLTAMVFGVALLASGLASAGVGVYSGQVVMQGFIRRRVPLWLRRAVSMVPPLVLLGSGMNPTLALVLSQVVLSFGIPFALVPLVALTSSRSVMAGLVNRPATTALAIAVAALIIMLNGFLLYLTLR
jgi:manganese transport protein